MGFNLPMTAARRNSRRTKPSASGDRSSRPCVPTDAVFTIDELVTYLKLPKSTVYKLAQEGKIPGQKVGRHWRFHRDTIDRWLTGQADSKPAERRRR
jgi:excisionase family DNA binding protein